MKHVGLSASDGIIVTNFDLFMHQFNNILGSLKKEKLLVIFDNVDDFDNIPKFLPLRHRAKNFVLLCSAISPNYGLVFVEESFSSYALVQQ